LPFKGQYEICTRVYDVGQTSHSTVSRSQLQLATFLQTDCCTLTLALVQKG